MCTRAKFRVNTIAGLAIALVVYNLASEVAAGTIGSVGRNSELKLACSKTLSLEVEDEQSRPRGNVLNIIAAIFDQIDTQLSFSFLPTKRALALTKRHGFDGLCACLNSGLKKSWLQYSEPLGFVSVGSVTRSNSKQTKYVEANALENRKDHVVGILHDDEFLQNTLPLRLNVQKFTNAEQGFEMLELGRIDEFLVYRTTFEHTTWDNSKRRRYSYREIARPSVHLCLASYNQANLLVRFNASIKRLKEPHSRSSNGTWVSTWQN
jgi:hypothetical protein